MNNRPPKSDGSGPGDSCGERLAAPAPTSESSSAVMRANKAESGPERALRSALHRRGLRFRKHVAPIAGVRCRPDVVFAALRVAVFVDGCFWHRCPEHYRPARRNASWWEEKLAGNVARDEEQTRRLLEAGWVVIRVWEHEPSHIAADRIEKLIARRRSALAADPACERGLGAAP